MTEERARFINGGSSPPVGWVYEIKHDGQTYVFQSAMRLGLMQQLRDWHASKGLAWPGDAEMKARVEDYICQLSPKGFCKGGPDQPRVPFLSVNSIRDMTRLILNRTFRGDAVLVPSEEAERRARICANCPQNLHGICTSCLGNEFQDVFRWLIARRRETKLDSVLDTCGVCGCLLRAKVHVSLDELAKMDKKTYPENCWLYNTESHKKASSETQP